MIISIYTKKQLQLLLKHNKCKTVETKTSKGMLLNIDMSKKYCIKEIIVDNS